jgi:hypothetical protein
MTILWIKENSAAAEFLGHWLGCLLLEILLASSLCVAICNREPYTTKTVFIEIVLR